MSPQFMFMIGVLVNRLPHFLDLAVDCKTLAMEAKELRELVDDINGDIIKNSLILVEQPIAPWMR